MPYLEIACFGARSAIIAADNNADRIELCAEDSQAAGGTTPSITTFDQVIAHLTTTTSNNTSSDGKSSRTINIRIMIRPRGGDFVYTDPEFQTMLDSIETFKSRFDALRTHPILEGITVHGGFVFGILTPDGAEIDVPRCTQLVEAAAPYPCTFHRAFDQLLSLRPIKNDARAIDDVATAGFVGILTSGTIGGGGAMEGRGRIAGLVKATVAGDGSAPSVRGRKRIEIIVGGGVRSANARLLLDATGAKWLHSSAIVDGKSGVADPDEIGALKKMIGVTDYE